jgi:flagellin
VGLRINQNIAAYNAYRNLTTTDGQMAKSLEKLSSGFRINRAADDAAGLSISERLRSQVGGLKMAVRNAQDGVSVIQTAEGALNEVHSLLQRMRDLAVQSSNAGSQDSASQTAAATEVQQAVNEIDRISGATKYGSATLLDASVTGGFSFLVGADGASVNLINFSISSVSAASLTLSSISSSVASGLTSAISQIDAAISYVSSVRSSLGAYQNRFEHTIANLGVTVENLSASESRIRDTDMAQEMVSFTRSQILMQAGTAMLGQANQTPQSVLSLLRG